MGLGGTAKKIQAVAERAEQMYEKLNELRAEVESTQNTVNDTSERVQRLEVEMAEQRAVLDAVAEEVGVDLETVSTDAHIDEAELDDEPAGADSDASDAVAGDGAGGDADNGAKADADNGAKGDAGTGTKGDAGDAR